MGEKSSLAEKLFLGVFKRKAEQSILGSSSSNLTDEENEERARLKGIKYELVDGGIMVGEGLSKNQRKRLGELDKKTGGGK